MPVSKLVFIFVPVRELVWFPNSDWRVYLSFHSGSISAQTEILVWELGPSAQTGINESQFANWDPSSRTGTVRILGLTYIPRLDLHVLILTSPSLNLILQWLQLRSSLMLLIFVLAADAMRPPIQLNLVLTFTIFTKYSFLKFIQTKQHPNTAQSNDDRFVRRF